MYWSIPPNALAPSMGAGEELHKAIGIGLQYKLLRLVNGQRLLFYYFCKVVPTIPFNLLSDDDLGLADITCDIKPVGRTKEMIMTLQHLTSTTGSVCRKVSGLHILREEPINLDQLRSDIADRADALQRQAARHFNIDTAKLRCVSSIVGNDFAAHGQHTSITVDGAVLLTRVGDSSDTTPSTPATTASSVPARLPMRHMKAIFGYPSSKTITSLARLVDAKIDHSSDKHRSATNETANARPKGLKPTHRISKDQFTPGSDQILDHLGERHRADVHGNKYILGHLDMATHLRTYTFHKSKKAADAFTGLKKHLRRHNLPVDAEHDRVAQQVRVRTDGSSSFKGDFDCHLSRLGISHWTGSAYVHDTNLLNHIEVSHQQVEHKARVALAQCAALWQTKGIDVHRYNTHAIAYMAHVCNYMPNDWHGGRPPIEFKPGRNGRPITLAELQQQFPGPFGCLAWQVLPLDKRSAMVRPHPVNVNRVKQWVDRGRPCLYLGVTEDNRYILLDVLTRDVVYTSQAKFSNEGIDFGYNIGNGPADQIGAHDWLAERAVRAKDIHWDPAPAQLDDDDDDDDPLPGWTATPTVVPPQQGVPDTPAQPPPATTPPAAPTSARPRRQAAANAAAINTALHADNTVLVKDGTDLVAIIDGKETRVNTDNYEFGDDGFDVPKDLALAVADLNTVSFWYDNGEPATDIDEPKTLSEALDGPMSEAWRASWQRELDGVGDRLSKVLVKDWLKANPGKRPLYSTVVIKVKRDENNRVNVLKSRLCAIGTNQVKGRDWHEKACATPRRGTINLLECMAMELGWGVAITDLEQAFLQGDFQDDQAGKQLLRLPKKLREYDQDGNEYAFQIDAPIYGLIDSANQLSRTQKSYIESDENPIPMRRSDHDYGLYSLYVPHDPEPRRRALAVLKEHGITAADVESGAAALHVLTWIDDNKIFSSHTSLRDAFLAGFKKRFKTKDLGLGDANLRDQPPSVYLANTYTYSDGRVDISNEAMADRIIAAANLTGATKAHPSPMKARPTLPAPREQTPGERAALLDHLRATKEHFVDKQTTYEDVCTQFRSLLMSVSYLAQSLHMELMVHVSILAQYQTFVGKEAWSALKHLLRHLLHIKGESVTYARSGAKGITLSAECDASFGQDVPWHGGARHGVLIRINQGAAIEVEAKRTKTVCLGTMGAELFGMSQACRTIEYYRGFLAELKFPQHQPTQLACDNRSAILTSEAKTNSHKSRHLSLRYLYVQECVSEHKTVTLKPTATKDLCADILTKPKEGQEFVNNKWKLKKGLLIAPSQLKT